MTRFHSHRVWFGYPMNLDISTLLQIGALLVSIAGGYFYIKGKVDGQPEENRNLWVKIHEIERWMNTHALEALTNRLEIQKELSGIKELVIRRDGKLDSIIEKLDDIAKQVDRLEDDNLKKNG